MLFYESPKNWGYYVHAQTVCTKPLLGGEGPGDEASVHALSLFSFDHHISLCPPPLDLPYRPPPPSSTAASGTGSETAHPRIGQ